MGRCTLKPPAPGYQYPPWAWHALGGFAPSIDPTVICAARTISASILELIGDKDALSAAKDEFVERTGGGRGGSKWIAPLLPADFAAPVGFWWPEYITTPRGEEWSAPPVLKSRSDGLTPFPLPESGGANRATRVFLEFQGAPFHRHDIDDNHPPGQRIARTNKEFDSFASLDAADDAK